MFFGVFVVNLLDCDMIVRIIFLRMAISSEHRSIVEPSWRQILTDLARPTRRGGIVMNLEVENDSK